MIIYTITNFFTLFIIGITTQPTPPTHLSETEKKTWGKENMKQTAYQEHAPLFYEYKIVSINPEYNSDIKLYRGEDAAEHFLKEVIKEWEDIFQTYIKIPKRW